MGAVVMMDSLLLYKILKNRTGAEISASGNPAIMPDTLKNNPMNEMKVFGWSKQESTTGAQLFPTITPSIEEKNGITVEHMEHGKIHISGTAEKTVDFIAPTFELLAGTYTLSMGVNIDNTLMRCTLSTTEGLPYFDILNNEASKAETTEDNMILYLLLRVYGGKTIDITIQPMLNTGTSALPWEPYTGGQPSPSPDYPQEIVSAGSDGKIGIEVRGKNLVDIYGYSANGIPSPKAERILFNTYGTTLSTTEKTDKLIVHQEILDGATANSYTSGYFCIGINRKLETGKDYIITFNINVIQNPFSVSTIFVLFNGIEANRAEVIGDKVTVKVSCKEDGERQYVEVRNCGMSMEISNFMITEKDENTIYEPYYEPQTISINTPTGLPAIPVDTDGNYTDANGQQWIADYVDLKRGKYVQNICDLPLKDIDLEWCTWGVNYIVSNGTGFYAYLTKYAHVGNTKTLATICQHNADAWGGRKIGCNAEVNSNYITISLHTSDLDDASDNTKAIASFKKIVEQTDAHVLYVRAEPIETDLTPEEIQEYKNLVTYAGTTIVENDAECYMEVSAGGGDSLRAKKLALILGE
jgi:hypothetical protein